MNYYVTSSIVSFILFAMGLSAVLLGKINYNENKESKAGRQMYRVLICSFFWDFGYAWMGLCFDSDFAYIARAISLLAVFCYLYFIIRYVSILVEFKHKLLYVFYGVYWIAAFISWFQIIQKSAVTFTTTAWGYWYISKMSWARILQFVAVITTVIVYYVILNYGRKRAVLKRDITLLNRFLLFGPILFTGYTFDTLIPSLFNVAAIPTSAIGAFFSAMLLFRISRYNKAFGLSKDNVSEYVFEDVKIPVIIINNNQRVALFNDITLSFFECEREKIDKANFLDFMNIMGAAHEDGSEISSFNDDIIVLRKNNNETIEFKLAKTDVLDKFSDLLYSIIFIQDMTKEQENLRMALENMQIAKDANMAKSNFLANMSHEIRTPMNAIIGMSEIIIRENTDSEILDKVGNIRNAANNLLGIINDVLDISKVEAGKYELIDDDYKIADVINDVSAVIRVRLQESKTKYILEIDQTVPSDLYGDQTRIRQILQNILGNAVKFTKKGSITLKIGWNNDIDNAELFFDVSDTGIGIESDKLDEIFGAFNQVDTRRNRAIQGTGLGLAISKNLAILMDGDISVESEYGKGSIFHIRIKQHIKSYNKLGEEIVTALINDTYAGAADNMENVQIKKPGKKVLVVDDIEMNLMIAQGLLQTYEINADTALSGAEAIEKIKINDYDLVFMDHMMPDLDGVDTTRIIRSLEGQKYKDLVIVALTANALNEAKELFLKEGMQDFLAKPIEPKNLENIIAKWL